jgi:hypothetical protein
LELFPECIARKPCHPQKYRTVVVELEPRLSLLPEGCRFHHLSYSGLPWQVIDLILPSTLPTISSGRGAYIILRAAPWPSCVAHHKKSTKALALV